MTQQLDSTSVENLLKSIALAMDEADYVRKLMNIKDTVDRLNREFPFQERLRELNHKIARLEQNLKNHGHKQ